MTWNRFEQEKHDLAKRQVKALEAISTSLHALAEPVPEPESIVLTQDSLCGIARDATRAADETKSSAFSDTTRMQQVAEILASLNRREQLWLQEAIGRALRPSRS